MSEKDRMLISFAESTRTDGDYITSLMREAESEECRKKLKDLAHWAYKAEEMMEFDF